VSNATKGSGRNASEPVALLLLTALLLLAYGLRLHLLGNQNLNWDEGYTRWIISLPVADLLDTTARDVHPPVYYLLLRAMTDLIGQSEFGLRYMSVLIGVLTLALVYRLGLLFAGFRVAVLALLLVAVARANIDIAQLARMHMLAMALATLTLIATLRFWRRPGIGAGLVYMLAAAGAVMSFYLAAIVLLATNLAFPFAWRSRRYSLRFLAQWIGLQVAVVFLVLPWIGYALPRMHGWSAEDATSFTYFVQFFFVTLTSGVPAYWEGLIPWVSLLILVAGIGVIVLWRVGHSASMMRDNLALLLTSIVTPLLVVFLLTLPFHNLGRPLAARYLLMLSSGFYVLLAGGLVALWRPARVFAIVGLALGLGLALIGLVTALETRLLRDTYLSIGATLQAHRDDNDVVLLHSDHQWPSLVQYYDGPWVGVPWKTEITESFADGLLLQRWESADAIWLVLNSEAQGNDPAQRIQSWLAERAIASHAWDINENRLAVYVRNPERAEDLLALASGYEPESDVLGVPLPTYAVGDTLAFAMLRGTDDPGSISVSLSQGEFQKRYDAATIGRRSLVTLPLTPELPEGQYTVSIEGETIGSFALVQMDRIAPSDETRIANPLKLQFGESIRLLGYDINGNEFAAGDRVEVTLYWQADDLLQARYKVLVFALGEAFNPATGNPLWGQHDSEPMDWQLPTTRWPPGTVIADTHVFALPDNTPSGTLDLGTVMYGLVDGVRLPVVGAQGEVLGDMALFTSLRIID
jgi:mannosyltransferase